MKKQVCITKDNTQISIDGVLYLQITDPKAAAYGTSDPLSSMEQLAQTIMRSDVGKRQLDDVLSSRTELNASIVAELDSAAVNWGVKVLRYEIRDIAAPEDVIRAMELQITAERQKRAVIAKSEGDPAKTGDQCVRGRATAADQPRRGRATVPNPPRPRPGPGGDDGGRGNGEGTCDGRHCTERGRRQGCHDDAEFAEDFISQWGAIARDLA